MRQAKRMVVCQQGSLLSAVQLSWPLFCFCISFLTFARSLGREESAKGLTIAPFLRLALRGLALRGGTSEDEAGMRESSLCRLLRRDDVKDNNALFEISWKIAKLNARKHANLSADELNNPDSAEDVYQLAKCLHMRQKPSEARAVEVLYRRCLRLSPIHKGARTQQNQRRDTAQSCYPRTVSGAA